LIAKALADPRRHQILKQVGAATKGVGCSDVRECQSVTAARLVVRGDVLKAYLDHLAAI
jgi:hypothetical protein